MARVVVAVASAAVGLLSVGCTGPSGAESPPSSQVPQTSGLKNFDACTVLESQELRARGLPPHGEPKSQAGEVGCRYKGDEYLLTVLKSEEADRAYWQQRRDNLAEYEETQVGSHEGFRSISDSAQGLGICDQTLYAGGGSVIVQVVYSSDERAGKDPCAKAMEFAEMIEPRLPG